VSDDHDRAAAAALGGSLLTQLVAHTAGGRTSVDDRGASRAAAALAQTVAQLVGTAPTSEILADIARHAVEGTRAAGAGIAVTDEDHHLTYGGGFGPSGRTVLGDTGDWNDHLPSGQDVIAVLTAGAITAGGLPGGPIVLPDARSAWNANPLTSSFAQAMQGVEWRAVICVPVAWDSRVIGVLRVYLPLDVSTPSEIELAFCAALANHAAVAVTNARLSAQAARTAALRERSRLARELHDSVSQTLFSMSMHARAAQLSLTKMDVGADTSLDRTVGQLAELAKGTLAEMRALIFELRPESLSEEGLVGALTKQCAAISAREQLNITVSGPDHDLGLDPDTEEHVYRIVVEALNNVAKHAAATRVAVDIQFDDDIIRIEVADDGIGFEPGHDHVGHLGLSTMAQRAASIGASLVITSDSGTRVALRVPAVARAQSR
jgi:signal transduction histidine kinase